MQQSPHARSTSTKARRSTRRSHRLTTTRRRTCHSRQRCLMATFNNSSSSSSSNSRSISLFRRRPCMRTPRCRSIRTPRHTPEASTTARWSHSRRQSRPSNRHSRMTRTRSVRTPTAPRNDRTRPSSRTRSAPRQARRRQATAHRRRPIRRPTHRPIRTPRGRRSLLQRHQQPQRQWLQRQLRRRHPPRPQLLRHCPRRPTRRLERRCCKPSRIAPPSSSSRRSRTIEVLRRCRACAIRSRDMSDTYLSVLSSSLLSSLLLSLSLSSLLSLSLRLLHTS